ncbi:hypothetical protein ALC53_10291 [Atta colombica]|uniref:Uncharacterized protein n=1 Tax=Atta colombica TaxID=520822 RepID=A0A151I0C8_9HYME|nr:hypothetical protein ALC53_10291 [Atta colombica]
MLFLRGAILSFEFLGGEKTHRDYRKCRRRPFRQRIYDNYNYANATRKFDASTCFYRTLRNIRLSFGSRNVGNQVEGKQQSGTLLLLGAVLSLAAVVSSAPSRDMARARFNIASSFGASFIVSGCLFAAVSLACARRASSS